MTICVRGRLRLFGEIREGVMLPNGIGRIVECWWRNIPLHFPQVTLDAYVIMPDHMHGIILIDDAPVDDTVVGRWAP